MIATAFGGGKRHAFGVTCRHASRVSTASLRSAVSDRDDNPSGRAQLRPACGHIAPLSLREAPIADDIRPYGPNNSTTYGGADHYGASHHSSSRLRRDV